ncbi:chorismate mutase [Acidianus sp. HS-5]|uniref:chorismate mutase n=1 Tax=Acidianus sp. HS-5 TaxID=2886040 RepID=UPI001F36236E|nr:chorismate mutase [Acidianus sp. HS-5]BDC19727.1 chorismate mutase [Acidianus sp. HS-5]
MSELENLRKEIEEIDENIIKLLARRFQVSQEIGKIKKEKGLPITDENRESKVKENWITFARKYGIPETFVESFLTMIFSYSKLYQINPKSKRRIVIIGYGGMARSLSSLFKISGQEVVITGRNLKKADALSSEFNFVTMSINSALSWGEIIISTLPPSAYFSDFMDEAYKKIKGKIFMDITSSKAKIFDDIECKSIKYDFMYLSIHPLFGPYLYPVGEKVVLIPSKTSNSVVKNIYEFFIDNGLVPLISNLKDHEKAMSIVQVLPHFYLLALSSGIQELSKELGVDFRKYETTNFREVYKIISRVNEIKNVILEIQENNPYAEKAREFGVRELNNLYTQLMGKKNDALHS